MNFEVDFLLHPIIYVFFMFSYTYVVVLQTPRLAPFYTYLSLQLLHIIILYY